MKGPEFHVNKTYIRFKRSPISATFRARVVFFLRKETLRLFFLLFTDLVSSRVHFNVKFEPLDRTCRTMLPV